MSRRRPLLLLIAAVGFGLLATHAALALFDFGDQEVERSLMGGIYKFLVIGVAVVVACRAIIVPRKRVGWALAATALMFFALGEILRSGDFYEAVVLHGGSIQYPSIADGFLFAGYPFAIAGIVLICGRAKGKSLVKSFFNPALLVAIMGLVTLWSWLVFGHVTDNAQGSTIEIATTLSYPMADIVLLSIVLVALSARGWQLDASIIVLGLGLATLAGADSIFAYHEAHGTHEPETIHDTMWLAAGALIAVAAWLPTMKRADVDAHHFGFILTIGAIGIAVTVLVYDHYSRQGEFTVWLATVTLLVGIVELFLVNRARERAESSALAAAAESEDLARIVRSSEDAFISTDMNAVVTAWNEGAEQIFGYTAEEAIGRTTAELLHPPVGREADVKRMLSAMRAGESLAFETQRMRKDRSLVDVSLRGFPLRDASGEIVGLTVSAHDITERHRREEQEVRDLEGRLWRERIKSALVADDVLVFYGQPVIDLADGAVAHYELLIRMIVEGEVVTPYRFLPHAERSPLILEIDQWAVSKGLEFARTVPVAVNLSGKGLGDPGLIDRIGSGLDAGSIPPENLTFEITETAVAENLEGAATTVAELRALGCGVALDDFGTGFNSFTYLKALPVTELKIDMQFVRRLTDDEASERIVSSIVAIAHNFGMTTVAEGVEDEATLYLLRELGVDLAQGYLIGYPALMTPKPHRPKLSLNGTKGARPITARELGPSNR